MTSPLRAALTCVHARTSDTASIAKKTGIHEALIYSMWIRVRDRRHRQLKRDMLQTSQRDLI